MKFAGSGAAALVAFAVLAGSPMAASAQETVASEVVAENAAAAPAADAEIAAPQAGEIVIPKLTPVTIEILEPLGSKISKSLQTYQIALYEPIVVDGVELVPAGTKGMGEVVHAKKAGGMGAAGELVLAARYLEVGGRQLKLRSMVVNADESGKSRVNTVNALNTASAASPLPVGLIGYFITGGNIDLPEGTLASAKLAADFAVPAPAKIEPAGTNTQDSAPEGVVNDRTEGTN